MSDFVRSTVVCRCLRETLGPVLHAAGYQRVPKTQAAWSRAVAGGELSLSHQASGYGGAALGGNTLDASVVFCGAAESLPRRTELSRCLVQAELNELRALQGEVNARRPMTSVTVQWLPGQSMVGEGARAAYEASAPARYQEGRYVGFSYYSEEDVRAFASFLVRHGAAALQRFADGRCPPPVLVPLPSNSGIVPPAG